MISNKSIKECLKRYVVQERNKFVIFPFGENGVKVKNVLLDYYEIEPIMIVDNEYFKYSSRILSIENLRDQYRNDYLVILTVEDKHTNDILLNQLKEFMPISNIINLKELILRENNLDNFKLYNVLPYNYESENVLNTSSSNLNSKIKVRIVNSVDHIWNSIKTICRAFHEDGTFDLLIINTQAVKEELLKYMDEIGYKYIDYADYNIEKDLPEILIINNPYDKTTYFKNCRNICNLIVVASIQLVRYADDEDAFWELQEKGFKRFNPDFYLYDSLIYKEVMNTRYASDKFIEMGNAKFDGIYEACKNRIYPEGWEKLKGKKVVLWTTDHGVWSGGVCKDVTFDLYARAILRYANSHPEVGIIFRPHPAFITELIQSGLWNQDDIKLLKNYFLNSSNMVYDDSITYDIAFSLADGIIADGFCGISCSALPTMKPICLTYRDIKDIPYHKDLIVGYDAAYCEDGILSFLDKVKMGVDDKRKLREDVCRKYIKHFDGKNGWRIKEFIKKTYKRGKWDI